MTAAPRVGAGASMAVSPEGGECGLIREVSLKVEAEAPEGSGPHELQVIRAARAHDTLTACDAAVAGGPSCFSVLFHHSPSRIGHSRAFCSQTASLHRCSMLTICLGLAAGRLSARTPCLLLMPWRRPCC
eukprot:5202958-Pleurochrysis_carterae.AAC.2